ncbi:MAG: IgA Peptidase M64, partial [Thermoanaerobaculales bacterium]|nr:IgA Peptidase M64 [Thermoanaerobaculales bacterium]
MNRTFVTLLTLVTIFLVVPAPTPVVASEIQATLRVDYYHTGNALDEIFSLHQVVLEPLPWPGNPDRPVDTTNRGFFLFQIEEPISGKVLYSRGFSSIFQEWQTTAEAKAMNRTFHESVRFPRPDQPVRLRILKRDDRNVFATVWTVGIDPDDLLVIRQHEPAPAPLLSIHESGPPTKKVDILFLGEGYSAEEKDKFADDAQRLSAHLLGTSPFSERRNDFNVWALMPPAPESGVNRPSNGTYRFSPTGTTYDAFRSERYVLAFDNPGFRDIAQHAPYEFVVILANSVTYGGGGIFGLYSTAAAGCEWSHYLIVHEFGHHFAALADEYYTSSTSYESSTERPEPWEPNVTALHDP